MPEHTPTPWTLSEDGRRPHAGPFVYHAHFGGVQSSAEILANAAFIVKAVNCHDELTGALRFILAFYEPGQTYLDTEAWKVAEAGARRALAKAEA